jgi:hypothetical protein
MAQQIVFNVVFNEDSKMGSAILYLLYLKSIQKNTTFVRLSDYYTNIPLWGHSFHISLGGDSYASICSQFAYL